MDLQPSVWGQLAVELVFPHWAVYRLPEAARRRNQETQTAMMQIDKEQTEQSHFCRELISGSSAEGLALERGCGQEPSDIDTMYIYGGDWAVHIIQREIGNTRSHTRPSERLLLQSASGLGPPSYCRVRVTGDANVLASTLGDMQVRGRLRHMGIFWSVMYSFVLHVIVFPRIIPDNAEWGKYVQWLQYASCLFTGIMVLIALLEFISNGPFRLTAQRVAECFTRRNGQTYLASSKILNVLDDLSKRGYKSGPAQTSRGDDYVPALLCTAPIPGISAYLHRTRHSCWPLADTLQRIANVPGLVVAAGNKLSPDQDIEWRMSFSMPELLLAEDMPMWVKQGYLAFKYTVKSGLGSQQQTQPNGFIRELLMKAWSFGKWVLDLPFTKPATPSGRSQICSYHLKTVLMWELEQGVAWQDECPFQLLLLLLDRFGSNLEEGNIPHYFIPECNLLSCVPVEEQEFALGVARSIRGRPVEAILGSPHFPAEVFGSEFKMAEEKLQDCFESSYELDVSHVQRHRAFQLHEAENILGILDQVRERGFRWLKFKDWWNGVQDRPELTKLKRVFAHIVQRLHTKNE